MTTIASQITSLTVVYSIVYSDADQRKHQSSASLAFVWGIHRDRWIPRTKGQLRGKCFHLMTSSFHEETPHVDGLVQDCSISSALALEILQSCTKSLMGGNCLWLIGSWELWTYLNFTNWYRGFFRWNWSSVHQNWAAVGQQWSYLQE